jgi:hypothetical protein
MSAMAHVAYFAGMPTDKPLKYRALIDLALALAWGGIAYWQCGKSWMLFGVAILGCYTRIDKALRVASTTETK